MTDEICDLNEERNEWYKVDLAFARRLEELREYLKSEKVLVRGLPDLAAGFGERTTAGDIYFLLRSGIAGASDAIGNKDITGETWTLLLVIMLPHRYSKKGVYDCYKKARGLLRGFMPPYATAPVEVGDWRFLRDDSNWVIESTFVFGINIYEGIEEETAPDIERITISSLFSSQVVT